MQAALAALALRPQAAEAHFQIADFGQRLGVKLADARTAVDAHGAGHLVLADERFLAAHARLRFLGEFHQAAEGGRCDGDGSRVLPREQLAGLLLAEDWLEDPPERFGKLVVEVILGVDRDVVLEHKNRVLRALVVFGAASALDYDVRNAVSKRWG